MSAFLAVLLSVILLFQSTFCSLTGYFGACVMAGQLTEQCVYSTLADFDGSVKNNYGLYMLYQDQETAKEKIEDYLHTNLEYENQNGLFNLYIEEMDVHKRGFSQLSILEQQILEYCKYKIPLQNLEEFLNRAGEFMDFLQEDTEQWVLPETEITEPYDEEKEYDKEYYEQFDMREKAKQKLETLFKNKEENVKIDDTVFVNLPSQNMLQIKSELAVPSENAFENIENAMLCINDIQFDGLGTVTFEEYLINEYIVDVFNNKTQQKRINSYLNWETEYILFGNQMDANNALFTQLFILLLRFALNTIYIYGQEDMVSIADILGYLAALVSSSAGQVLVKNAVLASWSFMESSRDYDLLSKGKSVPIYKTEDSWYYWFSYNSEKTKKTVSLYYKDYLRIFLLLVPREMKLARILDVIQLNESMHNERFSILDAVTTLKVKIVYYYGKQKRWNIETEGEYAYEKVA